MRAPLAVLATAFSVGIGLAWWLKLPPLALWSLTAVVIGFFIWTRHRPRLATLCLLILVMMLGAFCALNDGQIPKGSITHYLTAAQQPITCEGMIVSDVGWIRPARGPARRQGRLRITRIRNGDEWVPSSGRVVLKLHAHNIPLAYGDSVRLSGSIRGPRPALKDKEGEEGKQRFDEGDWLWVHGVSGILTITGSEAIARLDTVPSLWIRYRRRVALFRWQLKEMGRSLLGPLEVGYLEAFLLGDGQGIPRETWEAFKKTGVVHVLVVSGSNVGLIGAIGLIALSFIRVPRAFRYHLLSVGLITYCILTGSDPPILRAAIMGVLLCLGQAAGREASVVNSLGLAAFLILATNPRALADVSFQLSFSAVLGLFVLSPWICTWLNVSSGAKGADQTANTLPDPEAQTFMQRWRSIFWKWTAQGLAASCGAWAAISPVVAWHFHMFTPITLIANLLVVPWASLLITVGFLVYAVGWIGPFMATPFAASFGWLVYGLDHLVTWLADLPGASWKW